MKVLFICKGNMFRSQMAAAIYNKLTGTTDAESAGAYVGAPEEPEGQKLENLSGLAEFLRFMKEKGMDISNHKTRKLIPAMIEDADTVVSMVEEPFIPDWLKHHEKIIKWDVQNPTVINPKVDEDNFKQLSALISGIIKK